MNLYDSLLAPRLKPLINILNREFLNLVVDNKSYTFKWHWDNDADAEDWGHTYIAIHHGGDSCIWIEFFPWMHYINGKRLEDRDTIYIYNGNNGAEAYIPQCIVMDEHDILGAKQDKVIHEALKEMVDNE